MNAWRKRSTASIACASALNEGCGAPVAGPRPSHNILLCVAMHQPKLPKSLSAIHPPSVAMDSCDVVATCVKAVDNLISDGWLEKVLRRRW